MHRSGGRYEPRGDSRHNPRYGPKSTQYPDGGFGKTVEPKIFGLHELLTRLGDATEAPKRTSPAEIVAVVTMQANSAKVEIMDDEKKEKLLQHLFKCVAALPTKTPLFGTFVGLVSADVVTFSDDVMRKLNDELVAGFQRRDYHGVKYLVRFAAELHNARVISANLLGGLLTLLASALPQTDADMQAIGNPQHAVDFLAYLVMTTLVFVGEPVASDSSLLQKISTYMGIRQALPLSIFEDETPEKDYLGSVWAAVEEHSRKGWTPYLQTVFKPWQDDSLQQQLIKNEESRHDDSTRWFSPVCDDAEQLKDLLLSRSVVTGATASSEIDAISGLRKETEMVERQFVSGGRVATLVGPRSTLRILQTIKPSEISAIERWAFDDYATDILHFFQMSTEEATKQLLNLPWQGPASVAFEDLLAEALFGELLRLPDSQHNFLLYSVVLCKTCKTFSDFPPALADVTNFLFENAARLNVAAFTKLVDWFAYHLSNFDFAWEWDEWATALTLPDGSIDVTLTRKTHFIKEVLQRCIRLSYYERVERSVPASFVKSGLLPPRPSANSPFGTHEENAVDPRVAAAAAANPDAPAPESVSSTSRPQLERPSEASFYSIPIAKELVDAIVAKLPEEQVADLLDKAQADLRAEEIIELLVRAIIMSGSKTPTHLQHALDRMLPALFGLTYGGDDASARHEKATKAEGEIIVAAVWKHLYNSPQHLLICLLKMLHAELISPKNVIDFILRDNIINQFGHNLFLWELVDQTVRMTLEKAKLIALKILNTPNIAIEEKEQLETQLTRFHKKLRAALIHLFARAVATLPARTDSTAYQFDFVHGALRAVARRYYRYMKETVDVLALTLQPVPSMMPLLSEIRFLSTHY
eukprot:TRINITY_DN12125_c0_g1_i1.p1 TRINITY_DN12125_c0_g1~~TRINITY_DN12125_c0_g1_i1.p1  ORF type:complete len:872 (+),score=214.43 TRINITY_DN12125_c0_g1_i1:65-2680(+)